MDIKESIEKKQINKKVKLNGWVNKTRRMGDLIFIDLRTIFGIVQLVIEKYNKNFLIASSLREEYVIYAEGILKKRKKQNNNIWSGEFEIQVLGLTLISKSEPIPLIINNEENDWKTKLKYRYLDLRNPTNKEKIIFRSKFTNLIRNFLINKNFLEIETPSITTPNSFGSDEFKVFSKNFKDKKYSLVQSPQIYKQLLMYSGFEKYFQIAKCFRDEDSRADRQLEFTQLDLEVSFLSIDKIQNIIEELIKELIEKLIKNKFKVSWKNISYAESISSFGTDKPDLRVKNKIIDITDAFDKKNKNIFIDKNIKNKNRFKALFFEENIPFSFIKKEEEKLNKKYPLKISTLLIKNKKIAGGSLKNISEEELKKILKLSNKESFTLISVAEEEKKALNYIGELRNIIAKKFSLFNEDELNFCWVQEWPLFEENEEGKLISMHNPFTSPDEEGKKYFNSNEEISKEKLLNLNSLSYDLVLNGVEIGGGAIRINDYNIQEKIFKSLGLEEAKIKEDFGWFLEAQKYGVPNHGGIALGIDRILSIFLKTKSIREVIAFPKNTSGRDELMGGPK